MFMQCSQCGAQINPGESFCPNCGAPVENTQGQNAQYGQPQQNVYAQAPNTPNPGYAPNGYYQDPRFDYTPISMWGYFGYEILFSIPCVGFILLLVFSFGGTKNINLRNFARSYFCFLIILFVLVLVLSALGIASIPSYYY
jgi:uncharacterized membrane protein YvbJ